MCGSSNGQLLLYNHSTGVASRHKVTASSCKITACQYAPYGQHLVYGCDDGSIVLWDPAGCLQLHRFGLHKAAIRCCSYSSDGALLAAGDQSGLISVWDAHYGSLKQMFRCAAPLVLAKWTCLACIVALHLMRFLHIIVAVECTSPTSTLDTI